MFCFRILLKLFICSCGAEWIKLPEMNMEHILSDDKPKESANSQDFVKVSVKKNADNGNISLSKTSPFSDDFSSIFSNRKTSLFDNIFNANDKVFVTKISEIRDSDENSKRNNITSDVPDENIQKKILNKDVQIKNGTKTDEIEKTRENGKPKVKQNPSNILKTIDFANIIKTIHQTISANIPNALKGKIEYLKTIHDNILINIDQQIGIIWPRNTKERAKRGIKEDEHHLDFPSAETALMSISFLTFAVFLIKLVMQVINVLKSKKMMTYTPMVTAMGRSLPDVAFKPGIPDETTARILQLMEDFKHN